MKRRDREKPTFANINFMGKCSCNCTYCLGGDIPQLLEGKTHLVTHFNLWPNLEQFLVRCMLAGIDKIYLTGINTDPILYRHLRELIEYLQWRGFRVGIRTNGYVALQRLKDVIDDLDDEIGLSIPSFNLDTIYSITGRRSIPKWGEICRYLKEKQKHWRISTVACYQNREELHPILRLAALLRPDYLQIRRIATDHRSEDFKEDWAVYDAWKAELAMLKKGEFYEADVDVWQNLPVCFWETVNTTVNSYNYFTDGTSTTNYFVVEGYENSDRSRPS